MITPILLSVLALLVTHQKRESYFGWPVQEPILLTLQPLSPARRAQSCAGLASPACPVGNCFPSWKLPPLSHRGSAATVHSTLRAPTCELLDLLTQTTSFGNL